MGAWLRQILARKLAEDVRGFARVRRDVAREQPLEAALAVALLGIHICEVRLDGAPISPG